METLAERIARDGPVTELDAIGWAIRLAKRLETLHALGVAHGSVSPACVIAAGPDRNARAYLADLQHTTTSPPYQSPERLHGGDISPADDVWALAATLYALLTGQSPFSGATDAEVRQKILAASPAPLAVFDVGDDDLQHILDHAFARDLAARTAGAAAFRRALEEWHPDRGVANLPPLEDEDATNEDDDDDGARTMIALEGGSHHDIVLTGHKSAAQAGGPGPRPAAQAGGSAPKPPGPAGGSSPKPAGFVPRPVPAAPRPAAAIYEGLSAAHAPAPFPKVNEDAEDDDDDENVRTVMRDIPMGELKALIALGPKTAGTAGGPRTPQAPQASAGAMGSPRTPVTMGGPTPPRAASGAIGGPPVVMAGPRPPQIADDPTDDDNVRTVMRTAEQIAAESAVEAESEEGRTVMMEGPHDPWKVSTGGSIPPAASPTYASAVNGTAGGGPDGLMPAAHGTQKIPPGFSANLHAGDPALGAAQAPLPDAGLFGATPQASAALAEAPRPSAPGGAPVLGAAPLMAAPQPWAVGPPQTGTSKKALVLAALIALIVAAAATFVLLRMKGI